LSHRYDVVITDMRLPDGFGMELLHDLRHQQRPERCLVMTAYGSAENAVEALRAGAFDYLTKPVDLKQFRAVVASAIQGTEGVQPPRAVAGRPGAPGSASRVGGTALDRLVGESEAMRNVKQRVAKVARGMAPVLVRGESGTGKELVARALHENSQRRRAADCCQLRCDPRSAAGSRVLWRAQRLLHRRHPRPRRLFSSRTRRHPVS
jgi:two-component system response regulator PilR (NtrC family)